MSPHFINLLSHSWDSFRSALGTLGFIAPLVVSVVSIVATLYYILRKHGKEAMLKHWKDNALIALCVTLVVTLVVYGPIWFYTGLMKTVFTRQASRGELANIGVLVTRPATQAELREQSHNN